MDQDRESKVETETDETKLESNDSALVAGQPDQDEPTTEQVVKEALAESESSMSDPFVGRWNRLVSTTNWEKGRIIHEWRAALVAVDAPVTEYSDEAWSRVVSGSVSGQHSGRLRRVYERFGDVYDQYDGLFWSHFQAALDWDDAEMWLEGSIQNKWSVANMRRQRWQAMGGEKDDEPNDGDVVSAEVDEDFSGEESKGESTSGEQSDPNQLVADDFVSEARSPAGPDFGDEDEASARAQQANDDDDSSQGESSSEAGTATERPFGDLPDLPEDLSAAFESFQLGILHHKADGWRDVSCEAVLASLEALKTLAVIAPE